MTKISKELDQAVREKSNNCCGYCLTPQVLASYKLEIEHIFPISKGGETIIANLCLACRHCNLHKSSRIYGYDAVSAKQVRLFNPNLQKWADHFVWTEVETQIIGKTPSARATVFSLKMNDDLQVNARTVWKMTGLFPPSIGKK